MRTPTLQINTIEIPVSNLKRAIDWYQSALGFSCEWSDEKHALLANEAHNDWAQWAVEGGLPQLEGGA